MGVDTHVQQREGDVLEVIIIKRAAIAALFLFGKMLIESDDRLDALVEVIDAIILVG
jgi:hypothetical protein